MVKIKITEHNDIDHTRYGSIVYRDNKFCCVAHNTKQLTTVLTRYNVIDGDMTDINLKIKEMVQLERETKESLNF